MDTWMINGRPVRVASYTGGYSLPFNPGWLLPGGGAKADDAWYFVRSRWVAAENRREVTFDRLSTESPLYREAIEATEYSLGRLVESKLMTREEVDAVREDRDLLPVERTTIFVYVDPREGKPKGARGCVDGTRWPGVHMSAWSPKYVYFNREMMPKTPPRIQLEIKFSREVDERASEEEQDVYELVRLGVDPRIRGGLDSLVTASRVLLRTKYGMPGGLPRRGAVYATSPATRRHQRRYRRYGFTPRYSPEDLGIRSPKSPLVGLRVDLEEFCVAEDKGAYPMLRR
jgi:hypothetical protein